MIAEALTDTLFSWHEWLVYEAAFKLLPEHYRLRLLLRLSERVCCYCGKELHHGEQHWCDTRWT